ncbi:MAG: SH3 domain-containing protein [Chloroflexota bacterium]
MRRYSIHLIVLMTVLFAMHIAPAAAQQGQDENDDTCPVIVQTALDAVAEACEPAGRNQACYGHILLAAEPHADVSRFEFEETGDLVNVGDLASLALSPMDTETGAWGVALMRLQANLPDTLPGQNVTFLVFGNSEIRNAVTPTGAPATTESTPVEIEAVIQSNSSINVRAQPSTNSAVIDILRPNATITADGRDSAGRWIRVILPDGDSGWIFSDLLSIDGDLAALAVVDDLRIDRLSLGQEIEGTISDESPTDEYRFEGQEGDIIDIRMLRASGDLDTLLVLQGPDGDEIASNDDDPELGLTGSVINAFRLPADGTYTVLASRYGAEDGFTEGGYTLLVAYDEAAYIHPMQAFYFQSGIGDAACEEAPQSGLLIQSPAGVGEVRLLVNEVRFDLGSTAFLQAQPDDSLRIAIIEGIGRAESFGEAMIVPAGSFVTVPMDANLVASGPPSAPEPYDPDTLLPLPLNALEREIEVAEPIDPEEIRTGDMTITLTWDNGADMDLWMIEPDGATVYYGNPGSISGAQLDVDANAACDRNFGTQETISWPSGQPRLGVHTVQVREWDDCGDGAANWQLTVRIGEEIVLDEKGTGEASFEISR